MCFSRLAKCENRFNKYLTNYTLIHCNACKLTMNTESIYEESDLTHFNPPFSIATTILIIVDMFLLHINESTTSYKHESCDPQFKIILSMHILFLLTTNLLYHIIGYIYSILWKSYETVI